jgi:hypothetical protein
LLTYIIIIILTFCSYKKNGYNCSLFTCCYAFVLYQSRFKDLSHKDEVLLNQRFHFPEDLVRNFRSQFRQLLVNLSNVYHLQNKDDTFTWDESQEPVVPLPVEFLTQLSDQEDYAVAFSTAIQHFFLPVDSSAVQQNSIDLFPLFDTSSMQCNTNYSIQPAHTSAVALVESQPKETFPTVHESLITAINFAVLSTVDDGKITVKKPGVTGKRILKRTTVKDNSAINAASSGKHAKQGGKEA